MFQTFSGVTMVILVSYLNHILQRIIISFSFHSSNRRFFYFFSSIHRSFSFLSFIQCSFSFLSSIQCSFSFLSSIYLKYIVQWFLDSKYKILKIGIAPGLLNLGQRPKTVPGLWNWDFSKDQVWRDIWPGRDKRSGLLHFLIVLTLSLHF